MGRTAAAAVGVGRQTRVAQLLADPAGRHAPLQPRPHKVHGLHTFSDFQRGVFSDIDQRGLSSNGFCWDRWWQN